MSGAAKREHREPHVEYLDHPSPGWFILDVMQEGNKRVHWVALMIDVPPDDLKTCQCEFPALFFVHPKDHRPGSRKARQAWFRIPGKHRDLESAHAALEEIMVTRH